MTSFPGGQMLFLVLASLLALSLALSLLWCLYLFRAHERVAEPEEGTGTLLCDLLSEAERQQLAQSGYLLVHSTRVANRVYRVPARPRQVEVYESDKLTMRLCLQPTEPLPAADIVLLHKLMIQGSEGEYLRQANIERVYGP